MEEYATNTYTIVLVCSLPPPPTHPLLFHPLYSPEYLYVVVHIVENSVSQTYTLDHSLSYTVRISVYTIIYDDFRSTLAHTYRVSRLARTNVADNSVVHRSNCCLRSTLVNYVQCRQTTPYPGFRRVWHRQGVREMAVRPLWWRSALKPLRHRALICVEFGSTLAYAICTTDKAWTQA